MVLCGRLWSQNWFSITRPSIHRNHHVQTSKFDMVNWSWKTTFTWGSLIINRVEDEYSFELKEEYEDTKGVILICMSKNRQHNVKHKKYKRTNNDLQNIHIKLKICCWPEWISILYIMSRSCVFFFLFCF